MTISGQRLAKALIGACGLWLLLLGLYFAVLRPALLPEDLRFTGLDQTVFAEAAPKLTAWLRFVFMVMGGYMGAGGALVLTIAARPGPLPLIGLAIAGLLSVTTMAAVNFAIASEFRWLLLIPALAWWIAIGISLSGRGRLVRN